MSHAPTTVALFCVTFNTYAELSDYYRSVCQAAERAGGRVRVDFFVADNTEHNPRAITLPEAPSVVPRVFPFHNNLGYLGAVQAMMGTADIDIGHYDYVAISNVDLIMEPEALLRLHAYTPAPRVGWLAPTLWSEQEQRDRNPGVRLRYTARRLRLLRLMFRFPALEAAYRATCYKRHRARRPCPAGETIYAGHGSFMLFTKAYFARCGIPRFPMFLYGEELYFAEQCRLHGLDVIYCPGIRLRDREHASVGTFPRPRICRYNYESLGYILSTFYKIRDKR